jgi:hypothetical protein
LTRPAQGTKIGWDTWEFNPEKFSVEAVNKELRKV